MAKKQQQNNNPFGGKFEEKKRDPLRPFYPVIGLLVMAITGAIAYFGAPFVLNYVRPYLPMVMQTADPQTLQWIFVGGIFLITMTIFGMIYAIFAPKQFIAATEQSLTKERQEKELERKRTIARKRKMIAKMKDANKDAIDI